MDTDTILDVLLTNATRTLSLLRDEDGIPLRRIKRADVEHADRPWQGVSKITRFVRKEEQGCDRMMLSTRAWSDSCGARRSTQTRGEGGDERRGRAAQIRAEAISSLSLRRLRPPHVGARRPTQTRGEGGDDGRGARIGQQMIGDLSAEKVEVHSCVMMYCTAVLA